MPYIIIEADEGRTIEQKRGLVKDITDAVCKNFNVPPEAVSILIHENKKLNRGKAGKLAIDSLPQPEYPGAGIFLKKCTGRTCIGIEC